MQASSARVLAQLSFGIANRITQTNGACLHHVGGIFRDSIPTMLIPDAPEQSGAQPRGPFFPSPQSTECSFTRGFASDPASQQCSCSAAAASPSPVRAPRRLPLCWQSRFSEEVSCSPHVPQGSALCSTRGALQGLPAWHASRLGECAATQQRRTMFGGLTGSDDSKKYEERRLVGYSPEQLYEVVSQVRSCWVHGCMHRAYFPRCAKLECFSSCRDVCSVWSLPRFSSYPRFTFCAALVVRFPAQSLSFKAAPRRTRAVKTF